MSCCSLTIYTFYFKKMFPRLFWSNFMILLDAINPSKACYYL